MVRRMFDGDATDARKLSLVGVPSMKATDLRLLVERLTKTVAYLEALLDQADTLLVDLERELEEAEESEGNGRQTRHSI